MGISTFTMRRRGSCNYRQLERLTVSFANLYTCLCLIATLIRAGMSGDSRFQVPLPRPSTSLLADLHLERIFDSQSAGGMTISPVRRAAFVCSATRMSTWTILCLEKTSSELTRSILYLPNNGRVRTLFLKKIYRINVSHLPKRPASVIIKCRQPRSLLQSQPWAKRKPGVSLTCMK